MENKKYLITTKGDFTTNIPVDLVDTVEKALQNMDYETGLQFPAFMPEFDNPNVIVGSVIQRLENDKWKLMYDITIRKR